MEVNNLVNWLPGRVAAPGPNGERRSAEHQDQESSQGRLRSSQSPKKVESPWML